MELCKIWCFSRFIAGFNVWNVSVSDRRDIPSLLVFVSGTFGYQTWEISASKYRKTDILDGRWTEGGRKGDGWD